MRTSQRLLQALGECVELGESAAGSVAVRDTNDPDRATFTFTRDNWTAFVKGSRNGEFDLRARLRGPLWVVATEAMAEEA